MNIHPTHAKKDLHEIIEVFQLYEVGDYKTLPKFEIVPRLEEVLNDRETIPPDDKNFFIKNLKIGIFKRHLRYRSFWSTIKNVVLVVFI